MKIIDKHHSTLITRGQIANWHYRMFSTLILTGILSVGTGLTLLETAAASSGKVSHSETAQLVAAKKDTDDTNDRENRRQSDRTNRLPARVVNAVRRDLSRQTGIAPGKLRVTSSSRQTWGNGCLGLAKPGEACTEAIIGGWRIVLSDGNKTWAYRTDQSGRILRLETQTASANLPNSVANAVLRNVSRQSGLPTSSFRIVQAERQNWSNGCLGLNEPGVGCTQAIVQGWRVSVTSGQQTWVYRTNESGSKVKLDEAASDISDTGNLQPTRIPSNELPPPLSVTVLFRGIVSGGIAGRTYQTTLLNNGQVIGVLLNSDGTTSERQTGQISRQQVREFQQLLDQQRFSQFNLVNYPANRGAADYITVTLSSRSGTTRYADMGGDRLPQRLQVVVQAWNDIASRVR